MSDSMAVCIVYTQKFVRQIAPIVGSQLGKVYF